MSSDAVAVRPSTYASPARRHAARSSRSQRVARMKARTTSPPPDLRIQELKRLFEMRAEQDSRSLDSRQGLVHNAVSTGAVDNGYKRSGWASLRRSTAAIKSPDREPPSAPESTVKGTTAGWREGLRHAGGLPGSWDQAPGSSRSAGTTLGRMRRRRAIRYGPGARCRQAPSRTPCSNRRRRAPPSQGWSTCGRPP